MVGVQICHQVLLGVLAYISLQPPDAVKIEKINQIAFQAPRPRRFGE